jgi:hypothetical protein
VLRSNTNRPISVGAKKVADVATDKRRNAFYVQHIFFFNKYCNFWQNWAIASHSLTILTLSLQFTIFINMHESLSTPKYQTLYGRISYYYKTERKECFPNLLLFYILWKYQKTSWLDWNLRKTLTKCYIWALLCGALLWTLRKIEQKYVESFRVWCSRRMEKTGWTERVNNKEIWKRVEEGRNIVHTTELKKANWVLTCIGTALWNILLKGTIEYNRIQGIRRNQLVENFKENEKIL